MRIVLRSAGLLSSLVIIASSLMVAVPAAATTVITNCQYRRVDYYKFGKPVSVYRPTNIKSKWAQGPFTITYTVSKAAEINGSVSASLSAEISDIFTSAKTEVGITVGGGWTWKNEWSYSAKVAKGRVGRIVMAHQMKRFKVKKYKQIRLTNSSASCKQGKTTLLATGWAQAAPRGAKYNYANVWRIEYQK